MKINTIEVSGFEGALYGMRLPYESNAKSDSGWIDDTYIIGENDMKLCQRLIKAGPEHRKFLRMIHVQAEIVAPRYWLVQLSTYKVGTVCNSSSTMHLITKRHLGEDDFSADWEDIKDHVAKINDLIDMYNKNDQYEDKKYYFERIKALLPESFMQKIVWDANYETIYTMYRQRKLHRLKEWNGDNGFCPWAETLPYFKDFFL